MRFKALDALRGFTVAAMILVNTPGSWSHIYAPLQHASWHGWTPTDFIFPFFLFIVGSAMHFSLGSKVGQLDVALLGRILKRGALIFLIGLFLNAFPFQAALSELRIMGVLQRIGIVYIFAAVLVVALPRWALAAVCAVLLLGYWYMLDQLGGLSLHDNPVRSLDLAVLGASHMWNMGGVAFDPEGLLSTLPAIVSAVAGYEVTRWLMQENGKSGMIKLAIFGALLVAAGQLWDQILPINKSLWTPSYVVFSAGVAMLTLSVFIWIVDVLKIAWLSKPCEVFGLNPLFIYALSWLWVVCYSAFIHIDSGGGDTINGYEALFNGFQALGLNPVNASLAFALAHVFLFWWIASLLYKRNIVIKI